MQDSFAAMFISKSPGAIMEADALAPLVRGLAQPLGGVFACLDAA